MKKSVMLRIAALFLLFAAVFTILVIVQFQNQRSFVRHIGALTVNVSFSTGEGQEAPEFPQGSGAYPLNGDVSLALGGMEFRLSGADGFALVGDGGARAAAVPDLLVVDDNSAVFYFSPAGSEVNGAAGRTSLTFAVFNRPAGPELRISGNFLRPYRAAEIPYRPQRNARVRDGGNGGFIITAQGMNFSFGRTGLDSDRRPLNPQANGAAAKVPLLLLENETLVSYRAVAEEKVFSAADYVLAGTDAANWPVFSGQWRDQVFASWSRTPTSSLNDEELITAYAAESLHRERYKEVISRVPRSFLDGSRRSYVSSVFLGGMNQALRSFTADEQVRSRRLAALLRDNAAAPAGPLERGSPLETFLAEPHVFRENYLRSELYTEGLAALAAKTPFLSNGPSFGVELAPALLEHWADWLEYGGGETEDNPFGPWAEAALELIAPYFLTDGSGHWVFVFAGGTAPQPERAEAGDTADMAYNFRLGLALARYGSGTGREEWAALGRSLVRSVLSMTDAAGTLPRMVTAAGLAVEGERISAARFYPELAPANYPHLETLPGPDSPILIWTAADSLASSWDGDILDISVTFPPGESHYLIIRRLRPFTRVQLYDIDYRTDTQFERYDSSGWVYNGAEQTMLIKMRHRAREEHIRIVYTPPPPPPPRPTPPVETAAAAEAETETAVETVE
jgi:hypothetical protein